jgi:hypothetical protein
MTGTTKERVSGRKRWARRCGLWLLALAVCAGLAVAAYEPVKVRYLAWRLTAVRTAYEEQEAFNRITLYGGSYGIRIYDACGREMDCPGPRAPDYGDPVYIEIIWDSGYGVYHELIEPKNVWYVMAN